MDLRKFPSTLVFEMILEPLDSISISVKFVLSAVAAVVRVPVDISVKSENESCLGVLEIHPTYNKPELGAVNVLKLPVKPNWFDIPVAGLVIES